MDRFCQDETSKPSSLSLPPPPQSKQNKKKKIENVILTNNILTPADLLTCTQMITRVPQGRNGGLSTLLLIVIDIHVIDSFTERAVQTHIWQIAKGSHEYSWNRGSYFVLNVLIR